MSESDDSLLSLLRGLSAFSGGVATGVLLSGPVLAVPALFSTPSLSSRSRLHAWSRLHADTTSLASSLLPILTGSLALCALLAQSLPPRDDALPLTGNVVEWLEAIPSLVSQNRRTLYTLCTILTLAIRPYTFGLLTPRIELLKAEEKRLILLGVNGLGERAMGRRGWRGASPTREWEAKVRLRDEGGADESDEEDNGLEDEVGADETELEESSRSQAVDTDAVILQTSRLQLGTACLSGSAFLFTVLELVCV
ncbi:hypothetical protein Rt10032_c09g4009 [Rhodotorula toruloides]|uniref:Uncharacterized protein n=1 Tax=Rhodotorula toruloides TaxID=5286 RepID=A0A511KHY9_RHOTO|nr:hypothetical protein Rt10032_c09g4009 [Rhodotorula toruloides]